jgi:hypothetical protein
VKKKPLDPFSAIEYSIHDDLPTTESIRGLIAFYNKQINKGSRQPIRVLHGWGSSGIGGIKRAKLRNFLDQYDTHLSYRRGNDIDGNDGYTIIFPQKALPTANDLLSQEILVFCQISRTKEKILGKFRTHGDMNVNKALNKLVKQGQLKSEKKGRFQHFIIPD